MKLTKRQVARLELRSWQRFHESNPNYLDWDVDERNKHKSILTTVMKRCELDARKLDSDPQAWLLSPDGTRTCERLGKELIKASPEVDAVDVKKLVDANAKNLQTQMDAIEALEQRLGKKHIEVRKGLKELENTFNANIEKLEAAINRHATEKPTSRVSANSAKKLGRTPGKVKLNRFESDAIKQYCEGKKPAEIDATMSIKSGSVRGMGKDKKEWKEGDTVHVIRAAKKRGTIRKNENGWEIVTN